VELLFYELHDGGAIELPAIFSDLAVTFRHFVLYFLCCIVRLAAKTVIEGICCHGACIDGGVDASCEFDLLKRNQA